MTASGVLHSDSLDSSVLSNEENMTGNKWWKSICSKGICVFTFGYCGLYFCYEFYKYIRSQRERNRNPYLIAEEGRADECENPVTEPGGVFDDKGDSVENDERKDVDETENKAVCGNLSSESNNNYVAGVLGNHTTNNTSCDSKEFEVENKSSEVPESLQGGGMRNRTNGHHQTETSQTGGTSLDTFFYQNSHSSTVTTDDKYKPTTPTTSSNNPKDDQPTTAPIAGTSNENVFTPATPEGAREPAKPEIVDNPNGGEGSDTLWRRPDNKPVELPKYWRSCQFGGSRPYKQYTISPFGANVTGFSNLGNTCFFNSMLQCVQQTLPLHVVLREIMTEKEYIIPSTFSDTLLVKVANNSPHPLTKTLQHLFHDVNTCKGSLSPRDVLSALGRENSRFARRSQEDSHEALRCLLNAVRLDEISAIKKSIYGHYGVNENPSSHRILDGEEKLSMKDHLLKASKGVSAIDGLIGTVMVSTTICHDCFTPLQIEELCLDLSLPMSYHYVPQHVLPAPPLRRQASKRKKKREKKKRKKVTTVTPKADQHQNVNNTTNTSEPKETTTQPHKDGGPPKLKVMTRDIEMKTDETCSEYDTSSDEDGDHLYDEHPPYSLSSSESDDDQSTCGSTPTVLKTPAHDDYSTTENDSTTSHSDTGASTYSSDEDDDDELFNGYFDLTTSHLFITDDPSSTEEDSDDEFVYKIDLPPTASYIESKTPATDENNPATDENGNVISGVVTKHVNSPVDPATADGTTADGDSTDGADTTSEVTDDTDFDVQPDRTVLHYKELLNDFLKHKGFVNAAGVGNGRHNSGTMLEQSLMEYTKLDVLDENNKFICQQCSSDQGDTVECRVSKQNLIHHLPPVLILQMKRFSIGYYNVTKDGRHVSFPLVLNMAPYSTSDCIERMADKYEEILYGLYAVVVHHGGTLHGGHYTAYVRQRPRHDYHTPPSVNTYRYDRDAASAGRWYDISDSWVSPGCTFSDVQRCQAYLLFYELLPVL